MKKIFTRAAAFLLAAATLAAPAAAAGPGREVYLNMRQIADNLTYTNTIYWDGQDGRRESHELTLLGHGDAYPIILEDETVYGTGTISKTVSYAESLGKNVLAAVNTDFFSLQTGVPMGIVIEDGVYKSSPGGRLAVSFDNAGGVAFTENAQVTVTLANNGGELSPQNAGKAVSLAQFNKFRVDTGGLYLYSADFSDVSTRTSTPGWFVRFRILDGTPRAEGTMALEVAEVLESDGAVPIGEGYLVLTAALGAGYYEEYEKFAVGDRVTLTTACSDPALAQARWATGGGDILVRDGAVTDPAAWDTAIAGRHPRTAVGVTAGGTVISYVMDGREATNSVGLSLADLAAELIRRGCVYAVNFDGGGSSAISVRLPGAQGCAVVNQPSDGAERRCATYMLFVTDAVSDGAARNLALEGDGAIVLPGSSFDLTFAATDAGYRPAAVPGDVTALSGGLGVIDGGRYTAGPLPGDDTVALSSPQTGAGGFGSVHIIGRPTSIRVRRAGDTETVGALNLKPGETVQLETAATYYYRDVISQIGSYAFALPEELGTVSETGLVTAGQVSGAEGVLTVTAGETALEIPVRVSGFTDTAGHWAEGYIDTLATRGIVNGVTPSAFAPEMNLKRADFIVMLYRAAGAAGRPLEAPEETAFTDVPYEDYYGPAVAWAAQAGITTGMGDGTFAPQQPLTRQQAFAFVYRALGIFTFAGEYDGDPAELLAGFTDASEVSPYAVTPAAALIDLGIIEGADGRLTPNTSLTRAQMAKILCLVLELTTGPDSGVSSM